MREVCLSCSMWRGPETERWRTLHGHEAGNGRYGQGSPVRHRAGPRPDWCLHARRAEDGPLLDGVRRHLPRGNSHRVVRRVANDTHACGTVLALCRSMVARMAPPRLVSGAIRAATASMFLGANLFVPAESHAQCGAKASSCTACHDGERAALPSHEAWHDNHAFADLCSSCHGGRDDATNTETAHVGLVDPFANADETCGSCHGASATALVESYRQSHGGRIDAGAAGVSLGPADRTPQPPPTRRSSAHGEPARNLEMTAVVSVFGVLAILFVIRQERARSRGDKVERRSAHSPA